MNIADKILQLKNDFDEVSDFAYKDGLDVGESYGYADGYDDGLMDGEQAQYDEFWDTLQRKGSLVNYSHAFAGVWIPTMFYPKYDMKCVRTDRMFSTFNNNIGSTYVMDLVERLNECGVILDTSKATNISEMFSYARISHIGILNFTSATSVTSVFTSAPDIITIDKIILKEDGSQTFTSAFTGCTGLENIVFEGVIGNNIDFKSCPLSTASIVSIIEHLSDSKSATLTLKATAKENMVFPYTSLQTNTTYNSWDELVATKSAWTISLI